MANRNNPADNLTLEARRKGGQNSPGNFKHDPQRAAEAGRKSHMGRRQQQQEQE